MQKSFENWKINKTDIDYSEYAEVASWCNQSGKYHIVRTEDEYMVMPDRQATEKEQAQKQIAELKRQLAQTDYVAVKIAEGCATLQEYAEVLDMRQAWRDKINELEKKL